LFASTLYHAVDADERRGLHRILADVAGDADERARHLALAATGPDPAVAAALDKAARRAGARGAPDAAAVLAEEAIRLTHHEDSAGLVQRRIDAAEWHFAAGATDTARRALEALVAGLDQGALRASILQRLAKVRYRTDSCAVAAELLTRALEEAGDDALLRAGIERDLAWAVVLCGDVRDAAVHAREALRLAEATADLDSVAEPLASVALVDLLLGKGSDEASMERAVTLERHHPGVPIEWRPSMLRAMSLKWSGDLDGARRGFDALRDLARDAGEEVSLPFLLGQMSETATWAGDWEAARTHAADGLATALGTGQEPIRASVLYASALVDAHLGLLDDARASAQAGLRLSEAAGSVVWMMQNQAVLGFIELSMDDHVAAHAWLAPLVTWHEVVGIREPSLRGFVPDEIEALVALGETAQADALLTGYEADTARLGRSSAALAAARARAVLVAASGDPRAAAAMLEDRLDRLRPQSQPFERARAMLTLGAIQRRTLSRKAARASLESAQATFTELGARVWSEKVAALLGGQRTDRSTSGAPALTPGEQRVAELVAGGATNREAADRLFVSVRAIEVHLTSIYRKLGVSSRTQLAVWMATGPSAQADGSVSAGRPGGAASADG
jgi:DNA-binding NarL/FixJ family response regulator